MSVCRSKTHHRRANHPLPEQLVQHTIELVRLRRLHIIPMILLNLREVGDKISLVRLDPLGLLQDLPAEEEHGEEEDLEFCVRISS